MNAPARETAIVNPDGCNSCFPCLVTTDTGCQCPAECHAPGSDLPDDGTDTPDRLSWDSSDFVVVRDKFHLIIRTPDEARLVETVDDFVTYCQQESRDPDELLAELFATGRMIDAPRSLLDELAARDLMPKPAAP